MAAGSGTWDFIENYHYKTKEENPVTLLEHIFSRVALRFMEPWLFQNKTLEMGYGSWFEISQKIDGTFEKIPMAFKFWKKNSEKPGYSEFGPLVFSQYVNHDLILCGAYHINDTNETNLTTACIGDPLGRRNFQLPNYRAYTISHLKFEPTVLVNILLSTPETVNQKSAKVEVNITPYYALNDKFVKMKQIENRLDGSWSIDYSNGLKDFVNSFQKDPDVTVYDPWEE